MLAFLSLCGVLLRIFLRLGYQKLAYAYLEIRKLSLPTKKNIYLHNNSLWFKNEIIKKIIKIKENDSRNFSVEIFFSNHVSTSR